MYHPKFSITNPILKYIGQIEGAKEVVDYAVMVPAWEVKFQEEARVRTVHFGTRIEGNELNYSQAERVMAGEEVIARERDVQEVINYRNVLKYIDSLEREIKDGLQYNQTLLKKINQLVCDRIVPEGQVGFYRQGQVVLKDENTDEVVFRPPTAVEVPYLVEDYFDWLNSHEAKKLHPVLRAGISHYYIVAVHPFAEGNGRTARAFATLVLFTENYDIKKFFSLEEYFDKDAARYYAALTRADQQNINLAYRDLTFWLEYFSQAMAVELTRIKEQIKRLSLDVKIKSRVGLQIPLNERQIKLVEYLEENGSISTAEGRKIAAEYSDDTLVRDFNYFVGKGLVRKKGRTKAARYVLKQ